MTPIPCHRYTSSGRGSISASMRLRNSGVERPATVVIAMTACLSGAAQVAPPRVLRCSAVLAHVVAHGLPVFEVHLLRLRLLPLAHQPHVRLAGGAAAVPASGRARRRRGGRTRGGL